MFKKKMLSFVVLSGLCLSFACALATPVSAAGNIIDTIRNGTGTSGTGGANMENIADKVYGTQKNVDINTMVVTVINGILGLLGVIFLVLTLYAGFLWMTAAGSDDKVGKAKNILTTAIIGLIIIFASYAIVNFVLSALGTTV
ncbi:MAG: hypothetical protein WCV41_00065 [Patescibacteria group bacterium]